jgi:hypothetical protein
MKTKHKYQTEEALDTTLEIVYGFDDADLAEFLSWRLLGEPVKVGDEVRQFKPEDYMPAQTPPKKRRK